MTDNKRKMMTAVTLSVDNYTEDNDYHVLLRSEKDSKWIEIFFSFGSNNTKVLKSELKRAIEKLDL